MRKMIPGCALVLLGIALSASAHAQWKWRDASGQIVGTFSAPQRVTVADGIGEYAVNRTINGENRLFLVYFGRNGDGVWRLGSM